MSTETAETVGLVTLQFANGGLFDSKPVDDYAVHLVRCAAKGGTPGPTLCGIDRFHPQSAGWSVGGGLSGPGIVHKPCPGCAAAAREQFPGLKVTGLGAKEMSAVLSVPWSHWNGGRFGAVSIPDHGAPSRPPGRSHQLLVLRELGWVTWSGSEPQPGDPDRHKHDAKGIPFFVHSHNDGADAHDHMPPEGAVDEHP